VQVPVGKLRWIAVVSPEGPDDIEPLLEPNENPAARTYQEALFKQGIPLTGFVVDDVQKEFERMNRLGVAFTMQPTRMGSQTIAVLNHTCGNLIQMLQV